MINKIYYESYVIRDESIKSILVAKKDTSRTKDDFYRNFQKLFYNHFELEQPKKEIFYKDKFWAFKIKKYTVTTLDSMKNHKDSFFNKVSSFYNRGIPCKNDEEAKEIIRKTKCCRNEKELADCISKLKNYISQNQDLNTKIKRNVELFERLPSTIYFIFLEDFNILFGVRIIAEENIDLYYKNLFVFLTENDSDTVSKANIRTYSEKCGIKNINEQNIFTSDSNKLMIYFNKSTVLYYTSYPKRKHILSTNVLKVLILQLLIISNDEMKLEFVKALRQSPQRYIFFRNFRYYRDILTMRDKIVNLRLDLFGNYGINSRETLTIYEKIRHLYKQDDELEEILTHAKEKFEILSVKTARWWQIVAAIITVLTLISVLDNGFNLIDRFNKYTLTINKK
ncbi:hypothetical protein G6W45_00410 [Campylobacter concisus]|uniref:hypothetical protein n=1 Tax=Campylobacter concisus TaxID=199 RepID=UPI00188389E2|nr:hypothetical protein [Campylobacter concisus]MBE9828232.1 hypothetical protein [Campylobacter concisus]